MSRALRRLALPVALGVLLALAGLAALALMRPAAPLSPAAAARQVAAELRCPDCQGLSVADSTSAAAFQIRAEIDQLLAAGRTPEQVRRLFVSRYGQWILLAPPAPLIWLLPGAALLLGVLLLAAWLHPWSPRRSRTGGTLPASGSGSGRATSAELERVRKEAEALDA